MISIINAALIILFRINSKLFKSVSQNLKIVEPISMTVLRVLSGQPYVYR